MVANFEYFATNFIEFSILLEEYKIIKYGGEILFLLYNYRRKLALRVSESLYILSERCCGLLIILITCSCTIKQKNEA